MEKKPDKSKTRFTITYWIAAGVIGLVYFLPESPTVELIKAIFITAALIVMIIGTYKFITSPPEK